MPAEIYDYGAQFDGWTWAKRLAFAAWCLAAGRSRLRVGEPNLASAGPQCPRDATQQCRLPTAVAAKNYNKLAGLDG